MNVFFLNGVVGIIFSVCPDRVKVGLWSDIVLVPSDSIPYSLEVD